MRDRANNFSSKCHKCLQCQPITHTSIHLTLTHLLPNTTTLTTNPLPIPIHQPLMATLILMQSPFSLLAKAQPGLIHRPINGLPNQTVARGITLHQPSLRFISQTSILSLMRALLELKSWEMIENQMLEISWLISKMCAKRYHKFSSLRLSSQRLIANKKSKRKGGGLL